MNDKFKYDNYDSPAQARARKLIKPLFYTAIGIFVLLFIVMIIDINNDPKPVSNANLQSVSNTANDSKFQAFNGLSDCQMAVTILKEYPPIIQSLKSLIDTPNLTYEMANNWKSKTNFDATLSNLDGRYPVITRADMYNSRLAKGLNFRIGQVWRDIFSSLRQTNNQGPIKTEQMDLIQNELSQILSNCKAEFDKK